MLLKSNDDDLFFCKIPPISIECRVPIKADGLVHIRLDLNNRDWTFFSRNLTSRRFKAISLYLTMSGFKIVSLAVTKVLLAGCVCQSSSHARPLFHSQKPKLGKCQSKQDEKGILLECTVSYLFMRIKLRMNHIHCIFPIPPICPDLH